MPFFLFGLIPNRVILRVKRAEQFLYSGVIFMSYNFANNQSIINKPSTFGLSPNGASLISYLWIPVTSVIVLVTEKENRLVRFHAFQALFMGLAIFAATIVLSIGIGI